MNLGKRLKQEREKRGIEGKALAERVGMSQSRLNALEVRDSKTCEEAAALADVLGISLRWLVSGEGSPEDAEWPFPLVSRQRWNGLPEEGRGYVQAATNRALDDYAGVAAVDVPLQRTHAVESADSMAALARQAAAWIEATPPARRAELLAHWNSIRSLVAQGMQVQFTVAPTAAASPAADSPSPTAKRGRSR